MIRSEVNSIAAALNAPGSRKLSWQQELKHAVRDPAELCRLVGLPQLVLSAVAASRQFPVFAPRGYIARMQQGNPQDPLLRQVLPLEEELHSPAAYVADPVGDLAATCSPGLLQKYASRVLMVTTGRCAVHCRYCFRRHFPYSEAPKSPQDWSEALEQIAADRQIHEVILSGGDPLVLVDEHLAQLVARIAEISHVRRLRVHTRLPIVIPQRVTRSLIEALLNERLRTVMVIHANHSRELDDEVAESLASLSAAGMLLLNQSVLLRGVNDEARTLAELSERLIELGVMPYYLHQLDRVAGAAHFEVSEERGLRIMDQLRTMLPGYAVPRYVREVAGAASKVPLG